MKKKLGLFAFAALLAVGMAAYAVPTKAAYKKINTITINGTQYDIVTFGSWPQTIKAANVDVSERCESKTAGEFTYYKGSDGEWYAKIREDAANEYLKYSNGTKVALSRYNGESYKWFKVEPIKWRVLTKDYNGTGKKLLFAENILIGKRYDTSSNNYQNSEIRKWLNSNANSDAVSDHSGSVGFLKTAFTEAELAAIADTSVDSSGRSTLPDNYDSLHDWVKQHNWNNGNNPYASDTPTTDKIFLLSEQEATKSEYGFYVYNAYKGDGTHNKHTRVLVTTDYAKASGAVQDPSAGMGGWWWLRSPVLGYNEMASFVKSDGFACSGYEVSLDSGCVAPALCVSYNGMPASTIQTKSAYKKNDTIPINGMQYDIVTFGSWPQTIKAANVEVSEQSESKTVGEFTYYKGSDGEWYTKIKESAYCNGYKYSDGTTVAQSSANSYKWFKVEPIKWRVLTKDYNGAGKKLLLAENILIAKRYDASSSNYQNSEIRKWLNSNTNSAAASDCSGSRGFLKTAFTVEEQATIYNTRVDNSARSTYPDVNAMEWGSGDNQYASDTPTTDKVFLLSEQEATRSVYGFDAWDAAGAGSKRILASTDYAMASGEWQGWKAYMGGQWWLRSPDCGDTVLVIARTGYADFDGSYVFARFGGVVPALCVSN